MPHFDWKRIALITGFFAVIALVGYLLFTLFFASTPTPQPTPAPTPTTPGTLPVPGAFTQPTGIIPTQPILPTPAGLPQTAEEAKGGKVAIAEINSDRNLGGVLGDSGDSLISFDSFDKRFYSIAPNGTKIALSNQQFPGVAQPPVISPQGDKAIMELYDGSKISYDFKTNQQYTLPKFWSDFSFAPTGDQMAFKSLADDPNNRWLAIANFDGTGGRALESLGTNGGLVDVNWSPSDQVVATYRESADANTQNLLFIGKNKENFKYLPVNGRGVISQWSPSGSQLLYSAYNANSDYKPQLWIVNALGNDIGNNMRKIELATWADKCTFADEKTLYCAVPKQLATGAGLIRTSSDKGEDYIYSVNVETGEKQKLAELPTPKTIEQIVASKDQSFLYLKDKQDGKIFTMKLK